MTSRRGCQLLGVGRLCESIDSYPRPTTGRLDARYSTSRAVRTDMRAKTTPPRKTISAPSPEKVGDLDHRALGVRPCERLTDVAEPQRRRQRAADNEPVAGDDASQPPNIAVARFPGNQQQKPPNAVVAPGNTSSHARAVLHTQPGRACRRNGSKAR